jgi:hypothetical protein
VEVIEYHQHGPPLRKAFNLPQQRLERLLLLPLRGDVSGGARSTDGNECKSAISATSSIGSAVAASNACSFTSLAPGSSACWNPAARSIYAITGRAVLRCGEQK